MSHVLRIIFCLLARLCIARHKPYVIGVTGSYGKTTARHIITEIFQKNGKDAWTSEGNYNGEWGLALSVLQVRSGGRNIGAWIRTFLRSLWTILSSRYPSIVVLEYGVDHQGEMKIQTDIVEPDIALFTTLSPSHLQGFPSAEAYYIEKSNLLTRHHKQTFAIGNRDDTQQANFSCNVWYGSRDADVTFSQIMESSQGTTGVLTDDRKQYHFSSPILGSHHVGILTGAYSVCRKFGIAPENILNTLSHIHLPYGRGNVLRGISDSRIIDGTYNGGFDPIVAGVRLAEILGKNDGREVIAVLGDMRELGDQEICRHQELWSLLKTFTDVRYIFVGALSGRIIQPLIEPQDMGRVSFFLDARAAGEALKQYIEISPVPLLIFAKGSQNTLYLEEAIKCVVLPEELSKLVRQDLHYMQKKQSFWNQLGSS